MAGSSGPLAGVVSPELCWSAHGNELRVHSTARLEPHAGHGIAGLPEQAVFRFFSEREPGATAAATAAASAELVLLRPPSFGTLRGPAHGRVQGTIHELTPELVHKPGHRTAHGTVHGNVGITEMGAAGSPATLPPSPPMCQADVSSTLPSFAFPAAEPTTSSSSNNNWEENTSSAPAHGKGVLPLGFGGAETIGCFVSSPSQERRPVSLGRGGGKEREAGAKTQSNATEKMPLRSTFRGTRNDRGLSGSPRKIVSTQEGGMSASTGTRKALHAARKLLVRAVEAVDLKDGRTALLCLVSERGLASEVHCVDPASGETLHVATGLPMMLTSLAVVPRRRLQRRRLFSRRQSGGRPAAKRSRNFTGLLSESTELSKGSGLFGGSRLSGGSGLSEGSGLSGSSGLSGGGESYCGVGSRSDDTADLDYLEEEVVVAVGGLGGRVRLVAIRVATAAAARRNSSELTNETVRQAAHYPKDREGGVPSEREGIPISTLAAFSVPGVEGSRVVILAAGWVDGLWSVAPCYYDRYSNSDGGENGADSTELLRNAREACSMAGNLASGNTGGMGAALHIVHQEHHDDVSPPPHAPPPSYKFRLWVSTSKGFLCFEASTIRDFSPVPQVLVPLLTQHRTLVPGARPQSLRALMVGGGAPLPLMAFASMRPSDNNTPTLVVLDVSEEAVGAEAAKNSSPGRDGNEKEAGLEGVSGGAKVIEEVELSTRCCSKSVVSTSPDAVWINPSEVKGFVVSPLRREEAGEERGSKTSLRARKASVHLKFSITVAEACVSEGGTPRVRAWEHSHVGAAHRVAAEIERLGLLAFCDPRQENLDAGTTRRIDAVGQASLDHIVGNEENLWGWGQAQATSLFATTRTLGQGHGKQTGQEEEGGEGDGGGAFMDEDERYHIPAPGPPSSALLLAARLQGAVVLGRGPAIARALTATVPSTGGGWMLPRALPVQEWAIAVAVEGWEQARALALRCPSCLSSASQAPQGRQPSARGLEEAFDALARRSRHLERILEALLERTELYCAAAAATTTATPTAAFSSFVGRNEPLNRPRHRHRKTGLALARELEAASRKAETAPLQTRLRRAVNAARLALRVSSAASWLLGNSAVGGGGHRDGVGDGDRTDYGGGGIVGDGVVDGGGGGGEFRRRQRERVSDGSAGCDGEPSDSGGLWGQRMEVGGGGGRSKVMEPRGEAGNGGEGGPVLPMMLGRRLRERCGLGLESSLALSIEAQGAGGLVCSGDNDPVSVLLEIASIVGCLFEAEGGGRCCYDEKELLLAGEAEERRGGEGDSAVDFLEKGLAVVAYSVMSMMISGRAMLRAPLTAGEGEGEDGGGSEGGGESKLGGQTRQLLLSSAETACDSFCEQVRLSPAPRAQARLSWLLDNQSGVEGALSRAAAALLCPRTVACLSSDPDLVSLAGEAIGGCYEYGLPVAVGATEREGGGSEGGRRGERGNGSAFSLLAKELFSPAFLTRERGERISGKARETGVELELEKGGSSRFGVVGARTVASAGFGGRKQDDVVSRGSRAFDGADGVQDEGRGEEEERERATMANGNRRERGQTVWETPRGVGLSPRTPLAFYQRTGSATAGATSEKEQKKTGTTVGGGRSDGTPTPERGFCGGVAVLGEGRQRKRERGKTVWETPRGVGLTPTQPRATPTPGSRKALRILGDEAPRQDEEDEEGGGFVPGGSCCNSYSSRSRNISSASCGGQRLRARGQTLWETPRGVGLTPKTPAAGWWRETQQVLANGDRYGDDGDGDDHPHPEGEEGCFLLGGSVFRHGQRPRARGQTVWETPRGVGLTPKTPCAGAGTAGPRFSADCRVGEQEGCGHPQREHGGYMSTSVSRCGLRPRARGQTVWETPRGVGLTPRTPDAAGGRSRFSSDATFGSDGDHGAGRGYEQQRHQQQQQQEEGKEERARLPRGGVSHAGQRPRARGQTVWETPRGVGLTPTPKTPTGGSASRGDQRPRARGQTVWETPRGVGLTPTPKTPTGGSASCGDQRPRARGQTVWETPRGVGLTPKTPTGEGRDRGEGGEFYAPEGYSGGDDGGNCGGYGDVAASAERMSRDRGSLAERRWAAGSGSGYPEVRSFAQGH